MSRNNVAPGRLSVRDKELVALGAAIASNCVPCVEYHVPQARKAGLSDSEIAVAIALADKVRRVPAAKVLQTASALVKEEEQTRDGNSTRGCGCSDETGDVRLDDGTPETDNESNKPCCGEGTRSGEPV